MPDGLGDAIPVRLKHAIPGTRHRNSGDTTLIRRAATIPTAAALRRSAAPIIRDGR